jgi:hypothetical protein
MRKIKLQSKPLSDLIVATIAIGFIAMFPDFIAVIGSIAVMLLSPYPKYFEIISVLLPYLVLTISPVMINFIRGKNRSKFDRIILLQHAFALVALVNFILIYWFQSYIAAM